MSLSEGMPTMTMPVTPANGGGNGFGFGGDGAWFLIILFLFAFCGWGGNGWGNNGNSGGVVDGYVLASDFSNIERKMDLIRRAVRRLLCRKQHAVDRLRQCRAVPRQPAGRTDAAAQRYADAGGKLLLREQSRHCAGAL